MSEFAKPLTAAVEKLLKKDATSVLIVVLIAFAAISFGLSIVAAGPLAWVMGGNGVISFLTGVGAFLYALVFKPDRLQDQETVRMSMLLDWIRRPDIDDEHRETAAALLPVVLDSKFRKRDVVDEQGVTRDD